MKRITTFPGSFEPQKIAPVVPSHATAHGAHLLASLAEPCRPKEGDPDEIYQCLQIVIPIDSPQYCIAQAKSEYSIVAIKRVPVMEVYSIRQPSPCILNILDAYRYQDSLFLVFERPGISLSKILLVRGIKQQHLKTLIREKILVALVEIEKVGFVLHSIDLSDVSISEPDGILKIAFHHGKYLGTGASTQTSVFQELLFRMLKSLPDRDDRIADIEQWVLSRSSQSLEELLKSRFLRDAAPMAQLKYLPILANDTALPDECTLGIDDHGTGAIIKDLEIERSDI